MSILVGLLSLYGAALCVNKLYDNINDVEYVVDDRKEIRSTIVKCLDYLNIADHLGHKIQVNIDDITINSDAYGIVLNYAGITEIEKIENGLEYIKDTFKAEAISLNKSKGIAYINIKMRDNNDIAYKRINLKSTEVLCGYDEYYKPITVDMLKYPHILVTGLSNMGKSGMVYLMLKNLKGANIVILNGFKENFPEFDVIEDRVEILNYIKELNSNLVKQDKPLFIVIDELMTIRDSATNKAIEELLCVARHYNIYIIGIIQRASKESLKSKDLFNTAISFRQRDNTNYELVFNTKINRELRAREFCMMNNEMVFGKTYYTNLL